MDIDIVSLRLRSPYFESSFQNSMHFVLLLVIVLDSVCLSNLEMIKIKLDVSISHVDVILFVVSINFISRISAPTNRPRRTRIAFRAETQAC